jgi:outer membrane protein OmpA-like peptidoglycan-associated protein
MKSRYLLGAGAALAVALGSAGANAQFAWLGGPYPITYYIGPEGGWTGLPNQKDTVTTSVPFNINQGPAGPFFNNFTLSERFNSGFNVGVRGGLQYGPLRIEEEYSYRHNGLNQLASFYGPGLNKAFSGERNTNSLMTNFIYDFTIGWPVSPHVGFGIGAVENIDKISLSPITIPASASPGGVLNFYTPLAVGPGPGGAFPARLPATIGGTFIDGHSWNFGYQAIAGIRYDINPLLAFDLDYRYLGTTQPTFTNKGVFPLPNSPGLLAPGLVKVNTGYHTNNIVASLTMKFGAPPPAPPPPAPPAPPPPPVHQVYLVFFDWDKYNITPEGMRIVELAAEHYRAGGRVQITVTGYTDTSGSAGYNQRLSERRANAVAAALERYGVPRSDMVVSGRGMNDLRVPTPPGVREPQNRRVEIVFP